MRVRSTVDHFPASIIFSIYWGQSGDELKCILIMMIWGQHMMMMTMMWRYKAMHLAVQIDQHEQFWLVIQKEELGINGYFLYLLQDVSFTSEIVISFYTKILTTQTSIHRLMMVITELFPFNFQHVGNILWITGWSLWPSK